MPVSGTHSIIGALLGFTIVAKSLVGIKWYSIGVVVASWFVSPAAAGVISIIGYYLIYKLVLTRRPESRRRVILRILPAFFGLTVFVNVFSILFMGPSFMTPFPRDKAAAACFALGVSLLISAIVWLVVLFYWVPTQRRAVEDILAGTVDLSPLLTHFCFDAPASFLRFFAPSCDRKRERERRVNCSSSFFFSASQSSLCSLDPRVSLSLSLVLSL